MLLLWLVELLTTLHCVQIIKPGLPVSLMYFWWTVWLFLQLSKCNPEVPACSPFENHYEEDYLVIDGIKLKAGECIENITNKFKEIDALMSEF